MNRPKRRKSAAPPASRERPLRMPEPIDAAPEDIARACMFGPPKREWDYLNNRRPDRDD